jgi:hypothetical protein
VVILTNFLLAAYYMLQFQSEKGSPSPILGNPFFQQGTSPVLEIHMDSDSDGFNSTD